MDNSASLVPGRNPTGTDGIGGIGAGFVPGAGTSSGANPLLPPANLPANAPPSNPYSTSVVPPTGGVPTIGYQPTNLFTGATPGATNTATAAASPIGGASLLGSKDLTNMYNELKKTYGSGVASAMLDFLTTGAGFNQSAINNIFAALQPGIASGENDLMSKFSAMGDRFGSDAQLGLASYLSDVNLNEGQIESQMYEQSVTNYINTLMGVGSTTAQSKANSPSFLDQLGGIFNLAGAGAGGAMAGLDAAGSGAGAMGSVLAGLAAI